MTAAGQIGDGGDDGGEIVLGCADLDASIAWFCDQAGFRLDSIFPADAPRVARLSGRGLRLCLDSGLAEGEASVQLPAAVFETSQGCQPPRGVLPKQATAYHAGSDRFPQPAACITSPGPSAPWSAGRAGMQYRDLLPDRLGGALIASHIRIPAGGEVPDYVHYHDIRFQIIYCLSGWVRLVYEDQGEPFVMEEGGCVLQPPWLRHRVLECSEGSEVIEFASPAEHVTYVEHEMRLPNDQRSSGSRDGQRFLHRRAAESSWLPPDAAGIGRRDCGVSEVTGGSVSLTLCRAPGQSQVEFAAERDVIVGVVAGGSACLAIDSAQPAAISRGSAFVAPARSRCRLSDMQDGVEWLLLDVALS